MTAQKYPDEAYQNARIHRRHFDTHFTNLPNSTASDPNLSFAAKGLLWKIYSLPPDWELRIKHLSSEYKGERRGNGIEGVRSIINELKEQGYIKYEKSRDSKGQWVHRYDVSIVPLEEFKKSLPERVKPDSDSSDPVKASILQSPKYKKKLYNKPPPLTPPKSKTSMVKEPVSLRSEDEVLLNKAFEETDLKPNEKKRLMSMWPAEEIMTALRKSKGIIPTSTLMGLLIHMLNNPDHYEDTAGTEHLTSQTRTALQYNEKLAKVSLSLSKKNDEVIPLGYVFAYVDGLKQQISLMSVDYERDMKIAMTQIKKVLGEVG